MIVEQVAEHATRSHFRLPAAVRVVQDAPGIGPGVGLGAGVKLTLGLGEGVGDGRYSALQVSDSAASMLSAAAVPTM
jgi:hypothetical protein